MSHATSGDACPNCNYQTAEKYCAQCGQEVHLHEDSLRALILHFVGHYFHVESKLWQTLKTLWTKPGALTLAYWQKQRARYISPISLYIFISAAFFLTALITETTKPASHGSVTTESHAQVSSENQSFRAKLQQRAKERKLQLKQETESKETLEMLAHAGRYSFFFLLPFLAFLLRLFFITKADTTIVHHAIFSLHIHSFAFSIMLLLNLNPFDALIYPLCIAVATVGLIYFVAALRKVYDIGWGSAAITAVSIGVLYIASLIFVIYGLFMYVL